MVVVPGLVDFPVLLPVNVFWVYMMSFLSLHDEFLNFKIICQFCFSSQILWDCYLVDSQLFELGVRYDLLGKALICLIHQFIFQLFLSAYLKRLVTFELFLQVTQMKRP